MDLVFDVHDLLWDPQGLYRVIGFLGSKKVGYIDEYILSTFLGFDHFLKTQVLLPHHILRRLNNFPVFVDLLVQLFDGRV